MSCHLSKFYYLEFSAIEWKGSEKSHVDVILHSFSYTSMIHRKSFRVKGRCKMSCRGGAEKIFQLKIGMQLVGITKEKVKADFLKRGII